MKRSCLLALLLALAPGLARADDLELELHNSVMRSAGLPSLTVHAHATISNVILELTGAGKALHLASGPLRPGQSHRFEFDPGSAVVQYAGSLTVKYPARAEKQDATMEIHFAAQRLAPMAVQVSPGEVDLQNGELRVTSNHVLGKVEVTLYGEDGQVLARGQARAKGAQPGTRFPVSWKVPGATVLKLHVQVTDIDGYYDGLDLFPWRVDVPHQNVVFASGAAAVPAAERAKLDAALERMLPQLRRAKRFAEVRLFVVGHTDTVGAAGYNQKLSEARARSIAGYFRGHGVQVPIEYAGVGESAPAVPTPDETAEARNRRAEYVLSVAEPQLAHAQVAPVWHRL